MPHVLIERIPSFPALWKRQKFPAGAYVVEALDIFAGCLYTVGSVCFLPQYASDVDTFLLGCNLFVLGSALFCGICYYTLAEAVVEKGAVTLEVLENTMYLGGSVAFLAGSVIYRPNGGRPKMDLDQLSRELSLGEKAFSMDQYCRHYANNELWGSVLFIVGSAMFASGAFLNGLHQRKFDQWASRMRSAVTSCYFGGSLLSLVGSTAFLPHLGCDDSMVSLGAWCFIVGSLFFVVGSCLSLLRTAYILRDPEGEFSS